MTYHSTYQHATGSGTQGVYDFGPVYDRFRVLYFLQKFNGGAFRRVKLATRFLVNYQSEKNAPY